MVTLKCVASTFVRLMFPPFTPNIVATSGVVQKAPVAGVAATTMVNISIASGEVPLLAVTVALYVPAKVGVPLIVPDEDSDSPGGNTPLVRRYVIGVDPVAVKVYVYAVPTVAAYGKTPNGFGGVVVAVVVVVVVLVIVVLLPPVLDVPVLVVPVDGVLLPPPPHADSAAKSAATIAVRLPLLISIFRSPLTIQPPKVCVARFMPP